MPHQYILRQPAKTATQSGRSKTHAWVLEPLPNDRPTPNQLTGWSSSTDTLVQAPLMFATQQEAEDYAKLHQLTYVVQEPHEQKLKPKAYADNYSPKRKRDW
jgi:hypothetical protein